MSDTGIGGLQVAALASSTAEVAAD
jgi:hypothetical protein